MLPDPGPVSSDSLDPGKDSLLHDLQVYVSVDPEASLKDVGGITSPSLETTLKTITVAGNLVFMTLGTSLGHMATQR